MNAFPFVDPKLPFPKHEPFINPDGSSNWEGIWLSFAMYALVVAILFTILFKHRHRPQGAEVSEAEAAAMTAH